MSEDKPSSKLHAYLTSTLFIHRDETGAAIPDKAGAFFGVRAVFASSPAEALAFLKMTVRPEALKDSRFEIFKLERVTGRDRYNDDD